MSGILLQGTGRTSLRLKPLDLVPQSIHYRLHLRFCDFNAFLGELSIRILVTQSKLCLPH